MMYMSCSLAPLHLAPLHSIAVFNDKKIEVRAILDRRLMSYDRINVHPLVNSMTTGIGRDDLIAFMKASGHDPMILMVGEASSAD